jgi:alpha-beta hydrolase superfamily lysophospholipase
MMSLSAIAKGEHPGKQFILLGHSMGSFAAQQYVLDYSSSIDGLVLFGSGALDSLARFAESVPAGQNPLALMDVPFEPARTPFDWLSRDQTEVDKFMNDPLCFAALNAESTRWFLAASAVVSDPSRLRGICHDLPIYLVSGSEDPVGQQLAGLRILEDRYRSAGITSVSYDFYPGGRHEMLHELNRNEVYSNLLAWLLSILRQKP